MKVYVDVKKIQQVFACVLLLGSSSAVYAQFDLDEFESDLSGGIEKEKEQERKEAEQRNKENQASDAPADGEFERIQVTGSHIKRASAEGVSPIQVFDRQALERSGYNSVSDVLRDMTANSFGSTREQSGSNAAGVASVSLRGLGSNKTLVLLNGKRLPLDAVTGSVDLNLIPMAAVQRIEVLKDGASATYGSDALGGVVNIITYKDYNGTEVSYQYNKTSQFEGGDSQQMGLITGSATSKSSIVTVINYRANEKFFSKDRPWTKDGISQLGNPGSTSADGGATWQADAGCEAGGGTIIDLGGGSTMCGFNFAKFSTELPELKQLSGMTLFEYETDHDFTLFGRVSASRKLVNWQYAPAPGVFELGGGNLLAYRTTQLGNRVQDVETTSMGYQIGAKGSITATWDWELTADSNRVRNMSIGVSGYALESRVRDLIQANNFDLESARYQPWQSSVSENRMYELKLTGELFDMPAGAVGAAIGTVYTEDSYTDKTDALSAAGEVFSNSGSNGGGKRDAKAFYAETVLPLSKGLELQLAGRHDRFSDFGSTTNPKVGLKWDVTNKLMIRASAGTGFMAPTLTNMYAASSEGYPTFIDAVACDRNGGVDCDPQQYLVKSGGNPDLKEEKSQTANIGFSFHPNNKASFGADVWMTKIDNVVGIDYFRMTQAELAGVDLAAAGVTIERDATTGRITRTGGITAPLLNLSKQEISGIDMQAAYRFNFGLRINSEHSIMFFFKEEGFPGTGFSNRLGSNGFPSWRNNTTFGYSLGKNNLNLLMRTIGSHAKAVKAQGDIPMYTEFDLNYTRDIFEKTTLTVGVQNLLATIPPLDSSNPNTKLDTTIYSPRGQVVFVGLKQGF